MIGTILLTDTSCLILLDKIDALELLPLVSPGIVVTVEIAAKFKKQLPEWITVMPVKNLSMTDTYRQWVDRGEASAIALAQELPNVLLVLDDRKGRRLAKQLGLLVTGTIGVLVRMREEGHINSLKPFFDLIKSTDFPVDHKLLDRTLEDFKD